MNKTRLGAESNPFSSYRQNLVGRPPISQRQQLDRQPQAIGDKPRFQLEAGATAPAIDHPASIPEHRPASPSPRQYLARRIGAALLVIGLGTGGAFSGLKLAESLRNNHQYGVEDRTPTEEEICAIRWTGQQALLLVAAEFTNDLSSRRAGASRIGQAIQGQDNKLFGVCYSPKNNYSRVLTDEAVRGLPTGRLVSWDKFPGRNNR